MISTHILDTSVGQPAAEVEVELCCYENQSWNIIKTLKTNNDGRINFEVQPKAGTYRLKFKIEPYFLKQKLEPFFVVAPVIFKIENTNRKYHIPLLLNPFGYSTYRGS